MRIEQNIYTTKQDNTAKTGNTRRVICLAFVLFVGMISALQGFAQTASLRNDTLPSPSKTNYVVPQPFQQDIPVTNQPMMDTINVRAPWLALKTNMLYDVCLIPNIGAEFNLGKRWTITFDWFYTWFSADNRHRYWQGYGGYLGVRKYFGSSKSNQNTLPHREGRGGSSFPRGHHLGLYALGLTYDVEWGGKGYQAARFGFGAGVEYGYSMRIGRRLNLDLSIGVGFQDGEYKEYVPSHDHWNHYIWLSTHKRHWWGPTKAEVSLVWVIGGNKKGGRQ
ncbi:MAG: DUF3575 domain-containing protein [Prevotella sp.]|nr:DUF3575 domain-containing protein [Prevotella sp.]